MPSSSTQSASFAFLMAWHHHPPVTSHGDGGFLSHLFGSSSWLGTLATAGLIGLCVIYILVKKIGRVLFEGTPWYARLALLGTAGYGIYRLLGRGRAQRPPWPAWPPPPPPPPQPWQAEQPWDGRPPPRGPRDAADS